MAKVEIEFSDVDYQLLATIAACPKESIEECRRHIIMISVGWDLKELGSQLEDNSTFNPRIHKK